MDVAVDANILIAALISPHGHTADLIILERVRVFSPEFVLEEIKEHREELLQKTELTENDFQKLLIFLISKITFFPLVELLPFLPQAKNLSPDLDDIPYFALALKLGCPLWSNDKQLKLQLAVKVFSTTELVEFLS